MKRLSIIGIICLTSGLCFAGREESDDIQPAISVGPYLGLHGGVAIPSGSGSQDWNIGPDLGGQLGYRLGNLRFESAFTYYSNTLKQNDNVVLRMTTLMANGYYDFNFGSSFAPFVGAGLGWLHAWLKIPVQNIIIPEDNEFAYQAILGVDFQLNDRTTLGLSYHYLGWSDGNGNQNLIELSLNRLF